MIIALNIILAAIVVIAIVGLLAWSIATQNGEPTAGLVQMTRRRRRRATARAGFVTRTIQNRT
jgi:predicted small integral membrane protein